MKLSKLLEKVHTHSGKASDTTRQLSFAGIAIAWIFKQGNTNEISLPTALIIAVIFFAISLAADLLQYVWLASSLKIIHKKLEDAKDNPEVDPEIKLSVVPSRVGYFFFIAKIVAVIAGYAITLCYLAGLLK